MIFSSSATVYRDQQYFTIDEEQPVQPFNPYGETKVQVEQLFMLNALIDRNYYLEQKVVKYIRDNNLTDIDYGNNHRISYYVNYQIANLIKQSSERNFSYKLINFYGENTNEARLVVKNFPEQKPKFVLIRNDS